MFETVRTVAVVVLGAHILLKFLTFLLPYSKRRATLDRSYGEAPTATAMADTVSLVVVVALAVLIFWRNADPIAFLGGLWIGATLIQVYFHRFHTPLDRDHAPPPKVSPIKTMSYAIQAAPWRPWREIALLAALVIVSLILIAGRP